MSFTPVAQASPVFFFPDEAIDLLLLLEQELPKYLQKNLDESGKIVVEAAQDLIVSAEKAELDTIVRVSKYFLKILDDCLGGETAVDDKVACYLSDTLELLQVLLMGSLVGAMAEEEEVLTQVEEIFNDYEKHLDELRLDALSSSTVSNVNQEDPSLVQEPSISESDSLVPDDDIASIEAEESDLSLATPQGSDFEEIILPTDNLEIINQDDVISESIDLSQFSDQALDLDNLEQVEQTCDPVEESKIASTESKLISTISKSNVGQSLLPPQEEVTALDDQLRFETLNYSLSPKVSLDELDGFSGYEISNLTAKDSISQLDYESLAKLSDILSGLQQINKKEFEIEAQQHFNIDAISKKLTYIQPLLSKIKNSSQELINNQEEFKPTQNIYSQIIDTSVESILQEIAELSSLVEALKVNEKSSNYDRHIQQQMLDSSAHTLDKINKICFQEIVDLLRDICPQLQKLYQRKINIKSNKSIVMIDRKLGEKIYTVLLCFCFNLLEQAINRKLGKDNTEDDSPLSITIDGCNQNNNLVITLSNHSSGKYLDSNIYRENESQKYTKSFRDIDMEASMFCDADSSFSKISEMACREIQKQLKDLQGTLDICSHARQSHKINLNFALGNTKEQLIFFSKNHIIYGLLLSSVKQIVLPQMAKTFASANGLELIIGNSLETRIPIIDLDNVLANYHHLDVKPQIKRSAPLMTSFVKPTYILVNDEKSSSAVAVDRFLAKETAVINSLDGSVDPHPGIVGTTSYKDQNLVLVLNGCSLSGANFPEQVAVR